MACGTPVAAYPVAGPRDVVGHSGAGVLHDDLRHACLEALKLNREHVRAVAERYSWAATRQFEQHLHPNHPHKWPGWKRRPAESYLSLRCKIAALAKPALASSQHNGIQNLHQDRKNLSPPTSGLY
jgi:hypothetical protein